MLIPSKFLLGADPKDAVYKRCAAYRRAVCLHIEHILCKFRTRALRVLYAAYFQALRLRMPYAFVLRAACLLHPYCKHTACILCTHALPTRSACNISTVHCRLATPACRCEPRHVQS